MKKIIILVCLLSSYSLFGKTMSFSVNPIALGLGLGQYSLDVAVGKHLTVGGTLIVVDISGDITLGTEQTGSGAAGRVGYYFSEALEDSWFLTAEYGVFDTDVTVKSFFNGSITGTGLAKYRYSAFLAGYHWQWSTFNISWGLGYYSFSSDISVDSGSIDSDSVYEADGFGGDLRIGLAF